MYNRKNRKIRQKKILDTKVSKSIFYYIFIIGILLLALYVRGLGFYIDTKYRDIYFSWEEGKRIVAGESPYKRVENCDMVHNEKYPTYLPSFYLFSALAIKAGLREFKDFLVFWRFIILIFDIALGMIIFHLNSKREPLLGILTAFVWFFCRWSLYSWEIANTESIILFLMILSFSCWDKKPAAAGFLFGAALSLKHFAILLIPVLLAHSENKKEGLKRLLWILAIPLATAIPFFLWSPAGFIKAMFFHVVREGNSHLLEDSRSIPIIFGYYGMFSRFFLFTVYILFWIVSIKEKWNLWLVAGVAFLLFVSFNPVLYTQYFLWPLPFCLIYIGEIPKKVVDSGMKSENN